MPLEKLLFWTTSVSVVVMAASLAAQAWVGITLLLLWRGNRTNAVQLGAESMKLFKSCRKLLNESKPMVSQISSKVKSVASDAAWRGRELKGTAEEVVAPVRRTRDRAKSIIGRRS